MQERWVWAQGGEDPLEEEMATHSNILAWEIPWTVEPGGLHNPWGCKKLDTTEHTHDTLLYQTQFPESPFIYLQSFLFCLLLLFRVVNFYQPILKFVDYLLCYLPSLIECIQWIFILDIIPFSSLISSVFFFYGLSLSLLLKTYIYIFPHISRAFIFNS